MFPSLAQLSPSFFSFFFLPLVLSQYSFYPNKFTLHFFQAKKRINLLNGLFWSVNCRYFALLQSNPPLWSLITNHKIGTSGRRSGCQLATKLVATTNDIIFAKLSLNSTQPQLKLRLRLALFPVSDKPPTRKSSDMELCLNQFSGRELKFGTDTHYTNLIKII